jgi:dipeptidyl aminopeptidase/acylaminoacyl peptidase
MKTNRKDQQSKKAETYKGILELLLLIGIILLIPLFFAVRTSATSQPASPTQTIAAPVTTSASEESAAVKPQQPPACTFPLAQISTKESQPEEYTFSEPKVVLTAPQGNTYNLAEWLPDNQQVLITEDLGNVDVGNDKPNQQSISLYNPETGETKIIAFRGIRGAPPSWLPDLNAVVYPSLTFTDINRKAGTYKVTRQIWISYGDPNSAQILAEDLPQLLFAVKPGGGEMLYLADKKISKLDKSLKKFVTPSFDPAQWDYGKGRRDENPVFYDMVWQPGTSLVFLYSHAGGAADGGYTFILDTNTGQICELDLGGWASRARWSLDGRYLAFERSVVYVGLTNSTDLLVLDTTSGQLYTPILTSLDMTREHVIDDFIWAPDSRHLLVVEHTRSQDVHFVPRELYLVDFMAEQGIQILPKYNFFGAGGAPKNNLAWSPDGSKLLIRCPVGEIPNNVVEQICFINVQRTGK